MGKIVSLLLANLILLFAVSQTSLGTAARFGYFWNSNSLPYDTELSYFFDVAVYPDGVFADSEEHYFAYVTAQNKHITYNGIPYSVEVVLQYGYGTNNINSIKRVWMSDYKDPSRFSSWWIDSDADGIDYWELSTLDAKGYLVAETDSEGDILKFLRVQAQTIFISETSSPIQSTWENRFNFYNFSADRWELKVKNSFTIPASSQAVRDATYLTGSGIWAGILETDGDEGGPPDYGKPPVKKIVYKNRWIRVVDHGVISTPNLDVSNNWWIEPQSPYHLCYRDQPVYSGFAAGSEAMCRYSTPTPTPTPTPTATPTPTEECEDAENISASPSELKLNTKGSEEVTVAVTGKNGCPLEGDSIKASVSNRSLVTVSPRNKTTDENGQAVFTIKAKNKTGNAVVTFRDGSLSTQVSVTVKK